jgi:hypothetical protein
MDHDTGVSDNGADDEPAPRAARVGVGIYYFEEPIGASDSSGE